MDLLLAWRASTLCAACTYFVRGVDLLRALLLPASCLVRGVYMHPDYKSHILRVAHACAIFPFGNSVCIVSFLIN